MCENCEVLIQTLKFSNKRIKELEAEVALALAISPTEPERYQAVKNMRARGISFSEIGKQMGVTRQRVYQIFKGGQSAEALLGDEE